MTELEERVGSSSLQTCGCVGFEDGEEQVPAPLGTHLSFTHLEKMFFEYLICAISTAK